MGGVTLMQDKYHLQTPLTSCATDNNQVQYTWYLFFNSLSIESSDGGVARQKHSCWILSVNKENVITLWMCLAILSHSDISVFHTFFFFVFFSWGSGYRYWEILISNLYCIFLFWQERRASFHAMYLTWHHQVFNKKRRYQVYWITNNFPQVRSKSEDWKTKWLKALGAIKTG
jgi:hypothetical protein